MIERFEFPNFLNTLKRSVDSIGGYIYKNGTLLLEAPGLSKDDVKIEFDGDVMHIYGEKEIHGQFYGISKKFKIPSYYLDPEKPIKAKIEDGIILIELNKREKNKYPEIIIS